MKSERNWRIIPVLLTALFSARLIRSAFLLFLSPPLPPWRIYGAARFSPPCSQQPLWISFHPLVTDCRALAVHYSHHLLPHPSFRPPISLTARITHLCLFSLSPPDLIVRIKCRLNIMWRIFAHKQSIRSVIKTTKAIHFEKIHMNAVDCVIKAWI